jgi:DedD protein
MADQEQDTEITLGAGKVLGLFFGLVILCGIFFGAGYTIGKNAATVQQAGVEQNAPGGVTGGGAKPSPTSGAAQATKPQDCATGAGCAQPTSADLSFYKAVEQKDPNAQLTTPAQAQPEEAKPSPEVSKAASPNLTAPAAGGYVVQVAAVSKQQDAEALLGALRKKQYPVFIATPGTDRLFHVQAGPFSDVKEAETVRTRLVNDGYNPILKR